MVARERPASRVWAPLQICCTGSHCVTRPIKCFTLCRDQKHFENCLLSPLPFSWPASAVGEPFFADSWKSISPRISASWRQSRPPGLADGATPTPVFHSTSPCLIHVPALAPRQPGRGHNSAEAAFPSTSASGVPSGGGCGEDVWLRQRHGAVPRLVPCRQAGRCGQGCSPVPPGVGPLPCARGPDNTQPSLRGDAEGCPRPLLSSQTVILGCRKPLSTSVPESLFTPSRMVGSRGRVQPGLARQPFLTPWGCDSLRSWAETRDADERERAEPVQLSLRLGT